MRGEKITSEKVKLAIKKALSSVGLNPVILYKRNKYDLLQYL